MTGVALEVGAAMDDAVEDTTAGEALVARANVPLAEREVAADPD